MPARPEAGPRTLLSRAVQLPPVHASDAELGPDLLPLIRCSAGRREPCHSSTIPRDGLLAETENSQKGFVDSPLLLGADPAYQVSETPGVDRAHLLDEHPRGLIEYVDLWAERGGSGTARCRRNKHNGPGQEFVGLDHDAKSSPLLFVPLTARHPEFMDVTPEHEGSP